MLKEEDKIFKNLYNNYGWSLEDSLNRNDWSNTKDIISIDPYLSKDKNHDLDNLIKDRKVKGKDTRTYKVSFSKIKNVMPEFKCKWSVKEGIRDLGLYLTKVNLTDEIFRRRGFYIN